MFKRSLKYSVPIAVFVIAVFGTLTLLRLYVPELVYETPHVPISHRTVEGQVADVPGLPVRLKIPRLKIDAMIESLGLTAQGDLDTPKGPDSTGWHNAGPRPGVVGSAVIDGHYGWRDNKPAVFDDLHTLQKGDLVYVYDGEGEATRFVVRNLISYQPNDDASAVFHSDDNGVHLNLITCQGVWNKAKASYSTRLVVFTDISTE